jgi:hypothetical protein
LEQTPKELAKYLVSRIKGLEAELKQYDPGLAAKTRQIDKKR